MTDLVERLREYALSWQDRAASKAIVDEAATEIAALRERVKELEAHNRRLGQGGAERYWEGRWRDEVARAETAERKLAEAREGLTAAIRAAKLAVFTINKQGVMPNSSWESGFNADLKTAEDAARGKD